MTTDTNAIADAAVADVQTAIDNLLALKTKPGADTESIDNQVSSLEDKQQSIRDNALGEIEQSDANKAAIAALNSAAANLKLEAANITTVANALTIAAKVVNYATDIVTALAGLAA